MDHVSTQLPYALTAAGASVVGYLFIGLTGSALAGMGSMLISLTIAAFVMNRFWGRRVTAPVAKA
jgi:Na+/H+ antiporter NhaC